MVASCWPLLAAYALQWVWCGDGAVPLAASCADAAAMHVHQHMACVCLFGRACVRACMRVCVTATVACSMGSCTSNADVLPCSRQGLVYRPLLPFCCVAHAPCCLSRWLNALPSVHGNRPPAHRCCCCIMVLDSARGRRSLRDLQLCDACVFANAAHQTRVLLRPVARIMQQHAPCDTPPDHPLHPPPPTAAILPAT